MGIALSAPFGKFKRGDAVRVRDDFPDRHHRTPWFVKGKRGVIRAASGPFLDPESRAHGGDGLPKRLLYHVEFSQREIWGERRADNGDVLLLDIYEQWLTPADETGTDREKREE